MSLPIGTFARTKLSALLWLRCQPHWAFALQSTGIIVRREDFGVRWQSAAVTPLWDANQCHKKRRGASLPAALQKV
jgi:hypothetical protein